MKSIKAENGRPPQELNAGGDVSGQKAEKLTELFSTLNQHHGTLNDSILYPPYFYSPLIIKQVNTSVSARHVVPIQLKFN